MEGQVQNKLKEKGCELKFQLGYLGVFLILLIIVLSFSKTVMDQNEDQEQIYYVALIYLIISVLEICLFTLKAICLIKDNIEIDYFDQENKYHFKSLKRNLYLFQFLPMYYFFLYSIIAQLLMAIKLLPSYIKICKEENNYYSWDENNEDCDQKYIPPLYHGEYTSQLINSLIVYASFLLLYLVITFFSSTIALGQTLNQVFQCRIQNNSDPKIKKIQSIIALILFIMYSIGKISLYIAILDEIENSSFITLIVSNIIFHIIMIFIFSRSIYIIKTFEYHLFKLWQNPITFINETFTHDSNRISFILASMTLIVTIVGYAVIERTRAKEIFHYEYFVEFDCGGVQIFVASLILISYVICPSSLCKPEQQAQQIQQEQNQQQRRQVFQQSQTEQRRRKQIKQQNNSVIIASPFIFEVKLNGKHDCAICLQRMVIDSAEALVQLPCHITHIFHFECINLWLKAHQNCPICNTYIKLR